MKLLIDGDVVVYRAGFACEGESLANNIQSTKMVLNNILLQHRHSSYKVYLTSTDGSNFRYDVAKSKPYKGQRTGRKPKYYNEIRNYLIETHLADVSYGIEADDAIAIEHTRICNKDPNLVMICSDDKDYDQLPGWYYNIRTKIKKYKEEDEANYSFCMQWLMGDTADNIPGVPGVGPKRAEKILSPFKGGNLRDMKNIIMYTYMDKFGTEKGIKICEEQRRLLWLLRSPQELPKLD